MHMLNILMCLHEFGCVFWKMNYVISEYEYGMNLIAVVKLKHVLEIVFFKIELCF